MELLALFLDYEDNNTCFTTILGVFTDLAKIGEFLQGSEDYFQENEGASLSISRLKVNPESKAPVILSMKSKVQDEDKDIPF